MSVLIKNKSDNKLKIILEKLVNTLNGRDFGYEIRKTLMWNQ